MIFSLDVRPARKGDCMLLHWGEPSDPRLMLIDGGPANVFTPHLAPRLEEIRNARGLSEDDVLPVDVLCVSHIDDDHIHGILDMTGQLLATRASRRQVPIHILGCWHNSFDDLIGNSQKETSASITAQFGTAALNGQPPEHGDIEPDAARILASVEQGHRLRSDAEALEIAINPQFENALIVAKQGEEPLTLDGGLTVTVIGPMEAELEALRKKFTEWLREQRRRRRDAEAALAAFADKSVPNLSSIVLLVEMNGRKILLTGDARGDKILEGLELAGHLPSGGSLHVNVLKVPHHGSSNNMERIFFERVTADHYVFSGDGEHGNPERATLEMLFEARGDKPFTLHFTYPVQSIDQKRVSDREKAHKRGHAVSEWLDERDALETLFASRNMEAHSQRIIFSEPDRSHVIDLGSPLGF